jgi:hypothetical protein
MGSPSLEGYGVGSRELVVAPTRPIGLAILVLRRQCGVACRLPCSLVPVPVLVDRLI